MVPALGVPRRPWTTDQYDRFSPSRRAEHYKTPMLVISNERDYRVPVSQGMQLFTALQVRRCPSRMVIFLTKITGCSSRELAVLVRRGAGLAASLHRRHGRRSQAD